MNEFLQQFMVESRELVEQASEGLLALEQSPRDAQRLDEVFRALHTLKGGAGIVEFAPMERLMHAAEDVLTAARAGTRVMNTTDVGHCLSALDQVLQWLDALEQAGELPTDTGREEELAKLLQGDAAPAGQPAGATLAATHPDWVAALSARHATAAGLARCALRYSPAPDCFFKGEDPLARMASLPGLAALELEPAKPWPPAADLDPFTCNLVFLALLSRSVQEVRTAVQDLGGQCEILALQPAQSATTLQLAARQILEAQLSVLETNDGDGIAGRQGSVGATAANVLRSLGDVTRAERIAAALRTSLAAHDPGPLRAAIAAALAGGPDESAAVTAIPAAEEAPADAARTQAGNRTLRVAAGRVDALVRLTGELGVARNAIAHLARQAQGEGNTLAAELKARDTELAHLVNELQRSVLGLRVLPLRTVMQRFPRVLREMSARLGKAVALTLEGEDTEADKVIVEMLFEPLLHVVRNALDHGIENPQERVAAHKPPTAALRIRGFRQSDQVVVEVSDDGRGMDVARIREVAQSRGVATADELAQMRDQDVLELVFAPGFSTAAQVTELSGRGVGMDAVRTALARIGGRVTLHNRPGQGIDVRFTLPFSVMMTHVMTVEAGGQAFGVPLDAVVETLRVPADAISGVGAGHAMVVRDRTLPVLDLANILGVRAEPRAGGEATIVIATAGGNACGLRVDKLGERMQIMLKPLEGLLAGTPGISGTTLLGDGRVLLVLDLEELLQ